MSRHPIRQPARCAAALARGDSSFASSPENRWTMNTLNRRLDLVAQQLAQRPEPGPRTTFEPTRLTSDELAEVDALNRLIRPREGGGIDCSAMNDTQFDRFGELFFRGHGQSWDVAGDRAR